MPRARRHGTAPLLEEPLHEPVLETVERDDGKAATGLQHLLGGRQPALELLQLLVQMDADRLEGRSEEHTSELQSLMRISYAVFCLTQKIISTQNTHSLNKSILTYH